MSGERHWSPFAGGVVQGQYFYMSPFGSSYVNRFSNEDRKLFSMATSPLGDTKFDGARHNISSFLDKIKERAIANSCMDIVEVQCLTFFDNYAQLTIDQIRFAPRYVILSTMGHVKLHTRWVCPSVAPSPALCAAPSSTCTYFVPRLGFPIQALGDWIVLK